MLFMASYHFGGFKCCLLFSLFDDFFIIIILWEGTVRGVGMGTVTLNSLICVMVIILCVYEVHFDTPVSAAQKEELTFQTANTSNIQDRAADGFIFVI